nr:xylulose kinase-1 [Tanacetum cinerariifolium]
MILFIVTTAWHRLLLLVIFSDAFHGWYYMVFVTTVGEEYDKVFNHLDMLNAPFEGKVFTYAKQVKPYVIVNGDSFSPVASASVGAEGPIPPKTIKQKLVRKNELKAKITLMLSILDEHLLKFYVCKDAKSLWEAIKNSLPSAWNNIALIMRNKSILDTLSVDDLYNNLKVYESEIKSQSSSSSNSHNVAFVSLGNSSNTNETVNTAQSVFAGNRNRDAPTRNAPADTSNTNALVVQDGICSYDWSFQTKEELINFALMIYRSQGYQMGLESLEARIVVNEQNEAVYEEDIALLKYDVQVKDIFIKKIKNQLKNALKENDDLKLKLKKFETSSKNLTKLINSQISAIDKTGLGYNGQMNESNLNDIHVNKSEVLHNVFDSRKSDRDDNQESESKDENVFKPKEVKKIVKPSLEKIEFVNARNTTVEKENKAKKLRKFSQSSRGNKRNWNCLMTQKLGDGFEFKKKACFVCGSVSLEKSNKNNSNPVQDLLVKEKMESQSETTQTVSALKLPILKTKEYNLWSMRMEQYLTFTNHVLWEVIVNGDSVTLVASASAGAE